MIFILAYTIQFTKSKNKTYANTTQGVQLELAGGWLGPNMLRDLWGGGVCKQHAQKFDKRVFIDAINKAYA